MRGDFFQAPPELHALAKAGERRAQQQVCDAYATLEALSGEAAELGLQLHTERRLALAALVTLAAAVARQQVEMSVDRPWYPKRTKRAVDDPLGLSSLSAEQAAALLAEDLNTLGLALLTAADSVPEKLAPGVRRCAASLVQVAAQLDETLLADAAKGGASKPSTPTGPVRIA
jgi:hypothetical protein